MIGVWGVTTNTIIIMKHVYVIIHCLWILPTTMMIEKDIYIFAQSNTTAQLMRVDYDIRACLDMLYDHSVLSESGF